MIPSWLNKLVTPFRKHAVLAIALGLAALCCSALMMFIAGYLISRTAQPQTTLFMVMMPVALVQVFGIGRPVTRYFERLVSHDWVFRVTSTLRVKLFGAISAQSGDPAHMHSTGAYLEYLVDDIGHLQNLYLRVAFPVIMATALWCLAAAFGGFFSPAIGLTLLALGALSALLVPIATFLLARSLQNRLKERKSRMYHTVTDDVLGATDLALAGRSSEAATLCESECAHAYDSEIAVRRLVRISELIAAAFLALGACAIVIVSCNAFKADNHAVNYIAAFALGIFPVIEAITALPTAAANSIAHEESILRLDDVVSASDNRIESSSPRIRSAADGFAVFLSAVSYRYPESERLALDHIDLQVPSGQKLAILGKSGSGKTTLATMLRGMIQPVDGTVVVNGDVGYVPQSPYLFDMTLRENLQMACPETSDEELESTLRKVGLVEKVSSLERGLDTPVGETGSGFSGGEAHRVSLARALLLHSPIIMLDEPFCAIDPATEHQLLDTMFSVFAEKTLIVITHHLADIERFDRVIFIEDGRITLDGAPRDLAREAPEFKKLLDFDRGVIGYQPATS